MGRKKREIAVPKAVFTDKPAPEVWTQAMFDNMIEQWKKDWDAVRQPFKRASVRQFVLEDILATTDKVLSGKIVVKSA